MPFQFFDWIFERTDFRNVQETGKRFHGGIDHEDIIVCSFSFGIATQHFASPGRYLGIWLGSPGL